MIRSAHLAPIAAIALLLNASAAGAQTAPGLGAAQSFAVLGGTTITNTGPSVITGNIGLSPGTAVTGFPPGVVVSGNIYAANAIALNAQNALTTAYGNLVAQGCTQNLTGQDLGGKTLTAGVYCFDAAAQLTGVLTLNAQGNASAVFIFKVGSALTTASGSNVVLINSASACNVFFQMTSSATLGTASHVEGNLIALTSITLTTGASVTGRALARNGAVTLDTNAVTATCTGPAVCPAISQLPATIPDGTTGVAYSQTLSSSGGTAPYTYTITGGALPGGLTLSSTGVVSGTPTLIGNYSVTIRGTDADGCFTSVTYAMTVSTSVPTLPDIFAIALALGLLSLAAFQLRRRPAALVKRTLGAVFCVALATAGMACTQKAADATKARVDSALDATKSGANAAVDATKAAGDTAAGVVQKSADKAAEAAGNVADTAKDAAAATTNAVTDPWITGKLKAKFSDETVLQGSHINIDTNKHVVTLTGTVMSVTAISRAAAIASGTVGVTGVVNQLVVR